MNWLDIVIIAVVGIPAFLGFRKGVIGAIFTLGGLIVGLVLARMYNADIAAFLATFVENETAQNVGAFIIVVVATVVVASFLARFVKGVLSAILLGWVDNVLGAVLGVAVGAAIASGIILVMNVTGQDVVDESALAPIFLTTLGPVVELIMGNVESVIDLAPQFP